MQARFPIGFLIQALGLSFKGGNKIIAKRKLIYFGDSKTLLMVKNSRRNKRLSMPLQFLLSKGVKAILIACNTATSAAAADLRSTYPICNYRIEPAIKPAVQLNRKVKF